LGGDQSNCNTAATAMEGYVPWVDLGLTKGTDAWGNPIRYRVHHNYAYFLDSTYSPAKNLDISTINPDVTANPALRIKIIQKKQLVVVPAAILRLFCFLAVKMENQIQLPMKVIIEQEIKIA
jgi:hypothetical protein